MDWAAHFDTYGLVARLAPALLTLFPLVVVVAVWFPEVYSEAATLFSVAAACGLLLFLAHLARYRGRQAQRSLIRTWGGMPTTILLRHRDVTLPESTKRQYHALLNERVPGVRIPSEDEEKQQPEKADQQYDASVRWLLEQTRGETLLFKENMSYGFRRNTFGLRHYGRVATGVLAVATTRDLITEHMGGGTLPAEKIAATIFIATCFVAWSTVVRRSWVWDAGEAYATRLLALIEKLR